MKKLIPILIVTHLFMFVIGAFLLSESVSSFNLRRALNGCEVAASQFFDAMVYAERKSQYCESKLQVYTEALNVCARKCQ